MNKLNNSFPIFGSTSKFGKLINFKGNVYSSDDWKHFYLSNVDAYNKGTISFEQNSFSGMFNFITSAINYLHKQGIPEFTNGIEYRRGSVVSFKGNIYVSLTDDNTTHVSQSSHWNKVSYEPNSSIHNECGKKKDELMFPIGTILTVPHSTTMEGFIDFEEGKRFNRNLYPELYKVLLTDSFATSNTNFSDSLPVGTMVHSLSLGSDVPDGWLEWNTMPNSLMNYPELKDVLGQMANRMPLGNVRQQWLSALANNTLPAFSSTGFHLRVSPFVGVYQDDSTPELSFNTMPVVIDESNSLNPIGYRRETNSENLQPIFGGLDNVPSNQRSPYVLVGRHTTTYGSNDVPMARISFGKHSDEVIPKTLHTRLFIKATGSKGTNIPVTHKKIIRAF